MAACTELKVDALKCADCDALYERPQVRNTNWNIIVMSSLLTFRSGLCSRVCHCYGALPVHFTTLFMRVAMRLLSSRPTRSSAQTAMPSMSGHRCAPLPLLS